MNEEAKTEGWDVALKAEPKTVKWSVTRNLWASFIDSNYSTRQKAIANLADELEEVTAQRLVKEKKVIFRAPEANDDMDFIRCIQNGWSLTVSDHSNETGCGGHDLPKIDELVNEFVDFITREGTRYADSFIVVGPNINIKCDGCDYIEFVVSFLLSKRSAVQSPKPVVPKEIKELIGKEI